VCRILFYTVDNARMQHWVESAFAAPPRHYARRSNCEPSEPSEPWDRPGIDSPFRFLSDTSRERSLVSWARGTTKYSSPVRRAETTGWVPARDALILHSTIDPYAYACLLERGALSVSSAGAPTTLRTAERAFLDRIKPLLGIWYGRLVFIRGRGQPCLVAQLNARTWLTGCAPGVSSAGTGSNTGSSTTGNTGVLLLDYPPAWAVLCPECSIVEMFGAEHAELCCCSLVEDSSEGNVEMADLEATFLDALGLALLSSEEGTVLLDIDADYAEA
jgi:hypothetical protein